jgi:hypothetical protein
MCDLLHEYGALAERDGRRGVPPRLASRALRGDDPRDTARRRHDGERLRARTQARAYGGCRRPVTQRNSNDPLYHELRADRAAHERNDVRAVYRIGDCVVPLLIADAVFDGHRLAREIDKMILQIRFPSSGRIAFSVPSARITMLASAGRSATESSAPAAPNSHKWRKSGALPGSVGTCVDRVALSWSRSSPTTAASAALSTRSTPEHEGKREDGDDRTGQRKVRALEANLRSPSAHSGLDNRRAALHSSADKTQRERPHRR